MCGIIGVLGNHEAAPILVEALKRLEYRGYDSAGIATVNNGTLERRRAVGKLVNLSDLLVHEPLAGKSGIGHTRWATHGAPSVTNAHPHQAGGVAVVHNGIIENFRELREELAAAGVAFVTETDTETVALLTQHHLQSGLSPLDATRATLARLEGAFALAFLFDGENDLMIAARKGSPLAIGYGDGEMYVGSDAIALSPLTDRIAYLEEGDYAILTRTSVEIRDAKDALANREVKTIQIDNTRIDKDGHKHFMAKEIAEQPGVLQTAISQYIDADGQITLPGEGMDFTQIDRITMVACGTAYLACLTAKYWFEQIARIPVEVDVASEFRYREPPISPRTLAMFVSQSGETADTLAALRYCAGKADKIASVVNVNESSIARESDLYLPIHAGVEVGVASTKAFTCQLTVLFTMVLKAAHARGVLDDATLAQHVADLRGLPGVVNAALSQNHTLQATARKLASARDVLFLGRGQMYPLAHEGALKLKEISYIHAEAYASGEHARSDGAQRQGDPDLRCKGVKRGKPGCLGSHRDADRCRPAESDPLCHSRAAFSLSHCCCEGHGCRSTPQPCQIRHCRMTDASPQVSTDAPVIDAAHAPYLEQLAALSNPERAQDMQRYHKAKRRYLGLGNQQVNDLAKDWRASLETPARVALADALWRTDIFEARLSAAKLLTQARIRPDDAPAWALIASWCADFDSWAIADHACMAGQKRLIADPSRLDTVESWVTSDHMWTRRAAMVVTLPWTKQNHPKPQELDARDRILGWAATLVPDRNWFIQKSIAWWLRELSKHDPDRTRAFIAAHGDAMKPFAAKEAMRLLNKK